MSNDNQAANSQAIDNQVANVEATDVEATLLDLVTRRGIGKSVCPSEVARAIRPDDWRPLMDAVRTAARRLALEGKLLVTQRGKPVAIDTAKGPIRLTLPTDGTTSAY